ncbi:MAG: ABC transporter substrate-binding protein [Thaumarchaeota archaeon]|nr:ABC transporter substrate-binding protein [Nitrososphaerota archaeon]
MPILKQCCICALTSLLILGIFPNLFLPLDAQSSPTANCPSNQTFRITFTGGVPSGFPSLIATGNSGFDGGFLMNEGVYPKLSPTGQEYWNQSFVSSITHNENYTMWTFNTRPGLKWSDGHPAGAADILATYSSNYAFNSTYDFTGVHNNVVKSYSLNSSAAVFVLNQSDAEFPITISELILTSVIPASAVQQNGQVYKEFGTPVVIGPFYPINYSSGDTQMLMARNPYFNTTGLPEPQICDVLVNFVESTGQDAPLLLAGSTDLAQIDPSAAASILKDPYLKIMPEPDTTIQQMTINVTQFPFNMTAFRQAIVFGINDSDIVSHAWFGYAQAGNSAEGTVPQSIPGLYDPNQMQYSYSPNSSLSLLQSLGITKGSNGFLHWQNGSDATLNLWASNSETSDLVAAGIVQRNLQGLGFKVNVMTSDSATISSQTEVAADTMYLVGETGPIFPVPQIDALPGWNVYGSPPVAGSSWEWPANVNAEYEGNLTAIMGTANSSLLAHYLYNIEEINAKYLPVIVLAYGDSLWAYNTQHWSNWPTQPDQLWVSYGGGWNNEILSSLQPASTVTSATNSSTAKVASNTSTTSLTSESSLTSTSSSVVGGTSSSTSSTTSTYLIAAVVVIVIIAAIAVLVSRRRKEVPPSTR